MTRVSITLQEGGYILKLRDVISRVSGSISKLWEYLQVLLTGMFLNQRIQFVIYGTPSILFVLSIVNTRNLLPTISKLKLGTLDVIIILKLTVYMLGQPL